MKYGTLQNLIKIWYKQIIYFTFVLNNIKELEGKVLSIYLILSLVYMYILCHLLYDILNYSR